MPYIIGKFFFRSIAVECHSVEELLAKAKKKMTRFLNSTNICLVSEFSPEGWLYRMQSINKVLPFNLHSLIKTKTE